MGSTRAARRAGNQEASASSSVLETRMSGSVAETSYELVDAAHEAGGGGEQDEGVGELADDEALLQAVLRAVAGVAARARP